MALGRTGIHDAENTFSKKQSLVGVTTKTASTNVVHTGDGDVVLAPWFDVVFTTAATCASAGTVTVTLETASDEAFTSPVTLITKTSASATTPVSKGTFLHERIPEGNLGYLRATYTATQSLTAGVASAFIHVD